MTRFEVSFLAACDALAYLGVVWNGQPPQRGVRESHYFCVEFKQVDLVQNVRLGTSKLVTWVRFLAPHFCVLAVSLAQVRLVWLQESNVNSSQCSSTSTAAEAQKLQMFSCISISRFV